MSGRWIAAGLAAVVLLGGLAIVVWPSDDDDSPRPVGDTATTPASTQQAESLIRAAMPRSTNVRCRPRVDEWRCTWGTPTQSCNATLLRGRESFYAACSRVLDETHSIP